MSILLSRSPYEIITATNGIEAFERVRTDAPVDLILMDLELPGLTGGAVIRQLKNDPSTSAIPVIVTTSSDRESPLVQQALDAGASRILYKPTPMNVLTVEVNRYLSSDIT